MCVEHVGHRVATTLCVRGRDSIENPEMASHRSFPVGVGDGSSTRSCSFLRGLASSWVPFLRRRSMSTPRRCRSCRRAPNTTPRTVACRQSSRGLRHRTRRCTGRPRERDHRNTRCESRYHRLWSTLLRCRAVSRKQRRPPLQSPSEPWSRAAAPPVTEFRPPNLLTRRIDRCRRGSAQL